MRKKRALTLLEIMIVIFLIGLIGSVIGYNMKGSLEEGKAFRTRQGIEQIRDILLLEVAKGTDIDTVVAKPEVYLENSGMVKNVSKLIEDGWGHRYNIRKKYTSDIAVSSESLKSYNAAKKAKGVRIAEEDKDENTEPAPPTPG